ncbi:MULTISPECIES: hypothetical protein [unclassified Variovorax]|uniref:hypothetical protein n=1 Tax=unclassified Variovorax TaxID=663243 RepID=UPI0013197C41|nr:MULTISPECIES: hypothetical protein [unclassified Variovorax]VTU42254.1 hypothetical protein SRS16P1_00224 [Variovorax sp. SRS16]VTU42279.1 hypothetical protein E5P1_00222 [Variovorax sp. PBL-E5]VTU44249.1 hypothetical protein H6P1_00709 [Variovorax sp. PBL-H6]
MPDIKRSPIDATTTGFQALPRGTKLVKGADGVGVQLPLPAESARLSALSLARTLARLGVPVADPEVDKRVKDISRFVSSFGAGVVRYALLGSSMSRFVSSSPNFEGIPRFGGEGTATGRISSHRARQASNYPQSAEGARYYKR